MKTNDELRASYKRSDFVQLERGTFFEEVVNGVSGVPHDSESAEPLPQSSSVNDALCAAARRVSSR
jgi:hypothetical protein